MPDLSADREELTRFVSALFRYAEAGTFASLRAFDQFKRSVPPELIWPVKINGDLGKLVDLAAKAATKCVIAQKSVVFAPPICTFTNPDRARGVDLANGLTLSIELDEGDTVAERKKMEALLGPATVVVASGGDWVNETTGEVHTKLHLHWRLSEPTKELEDHEKLRQARDIAARLTGADPTGKPVVHPLRWPGSWNTKDKPRMARIAALNESAEIHLDQALDALSEAMEAAGLDAVDMPQSSGSPTAPLSLLGSAMEAIPNPGLDVHYDQWIRLGYAAYRASGGSDDGYAIWEAWSKKSAKFNQAETEEAWKRIQHAVDGSAAPRTIGAGTIFFYASQAGWKRPPRELPDPPPDHSADPGWWHSLEARLTEDAEVSEAAQQTSAEPPQGDEEIIGKVIEPHKDWLAPAPLREWIVEGWIPRGYVTGIYGDGAVGKSLVVQQLLTSVALALPWLGLQVRGGRAFGMMCEDDNKELHRRQESINHAYGVEMPHLENLRIAPRLGFDNLLMVFDQQNRPILTDLFADLCRYLDQFPPTLVVLDTLSDIFGGNELSRQHARTFVQGVGGRIARRWNCGVVIPAHPSAAGLATKTGTSGSTAWNNTFRSRIYMTRPENDEEGDTRLISRMKANYAPKKSEITVQWSNGAFMVPEHRSPGPAKHRIEWRDIGAIFDEIERAWNAGEAWSNQPQTEQHGRYLPLWVQVQFGVPKKVVGQYLNQWLAGGYLKAEIVDTRTKARGLRVIRRLQPGVGAEVPAEVQG